MTITTLAEMGPEQKPDQSLIAERQPIIVIMTLIGVASNRLLGLLMC